MFILSPLLTYLSVSDVFKAKYPETAVYLTQTSTHKILNNIIEGQIDVGFCGEFEFENYKDEINREFIYDDVKSS